MGITDSYLTSFTLRLPTRREILAGKDFAMTTMPSTPSPTPTTVAAPVDDLSEETFRRKFPAAARLAAVKGAADAIEGFVHKMEVDGYGLYKRMGSKYVPLVTPLENVVAEFLGLDLDKLAEEFEESVAFRARQEAEMDRTSRAKLARLMNDPDTDTGAEERPVDVDVDVASGFNENITGSVAIKAPSFPGIVHDPNRGREDSAGE